MPAQTIAPAMQVIVLGSGGGPLESNTTAFLVRSLASGWSKGSVVAVDAGVHLSVIARILEDTQPESLGRNVPLPHTLTSGPFAGMEIFNRSALANGANITQNLIDTYLITHPHLDHISGFVVNTAALPGTRPKRLAGLPSTISAFKNHIFNNVIWPNLSDENNGAGLVTYMRLVEGGSPCLGEGENRGYVEITDGLSVKMWSVSHGHCIERHSHRGSTSSQGGFRGSCDSRTSFLHRASFASQQRRSETPMGHLGSALARSQGIMTQAAQLVQAQSECREKVCVYDSSAYFIRDLVTAREVLIFGDVEPDSISLSPRNHQVWLEAAPKVAQGNLAAILIECSYDSSQADDRLYGHLKPAYLMEELVNLADQVRAVKRQPVQAPTSHSRNHHHLTLDSKKRKREVLHNGELSPSSPLRHRKSQLIRPFPDDEHLSPKSMKPCVPTIATPEGLTTPHVSSPLRDHGLDEIEPLPDSLMTLPPTIDIQKAGDNGEHSGEPDDYPLTGVKIVVIHMKEKLTDEPPVGHNILEELQELEVHAKLGCEFLISYSGQSLMV